MNSKRIRKKEGVLQVKLSSRSALLGKAWKRKWVVVQQNTSSSGKSLLLELYVEKGAYHKTVTSLLLEGVVSVKRTRSKTQEHAIEISSDSKVLLGVGAESETDAQEWLSMFRMYLLPPVKEMPSPPGIPEGFVRVSVVPNKDSERASLSGDYYAHISLTHINLYDTCTGKIDLDWDLRHLKKFMLISKCHQLDFEKIFHIMTSKRSVGGEGEFIFFSSKGKELVENLYERLSNAMTVKSRRSRSTSMLFEITAQELEQMFKDADQPPEETLKEDEREEAEANGETEGEVNGSVPEDVSVSNGVEPDGKDGAEAPTEVVEKTPEEEQEDGVKVDELQDEKQSDETQKQDEVAPEIDEKRDVDNEVITDEDASNTIAHDTNVTDVAQQLERVSSQDEEIVNERLAEDAQEDDKCNQTNPDEMDIGIQASTEEEATPPDAIVSSDTQGPEELDVSLTQVNEQCSALDQQESTTKSDSGIEQSTELKDPTNQDGQIQLSATVGNVEESVIVVPTSENNQEIANLDQTQPTASAAIVQESAESKDGKTRLDGEKVEVQPVINVPASKEQQELTEPDTEHQQVLAEPVKTDVNEVGKEPVNTKVEQVTEAETEHITVTEEHSGQDIQQITVVTEEQPTNEGRETEVVDKEHCRKPEEHSNIEKLETAAGDQERGTTPVEESINTLSELEPSSTEKINEATLEETTPVIVHEHEPSTDDLPHSSETDIATKDVVTPEVSETDAVPVIEGNVDKEVEPSETETSTTEVASESITEINGSSLTKSDTESSSEVPQKSSSSGDETKEDELNSNQNNSNTGTTGVRKISKTIPLPNSLTSRMASALRNAQKRKVSGSGSPSQETQTEFPSESQPTDDTPEIIV